MDISRETLSLSTKTHIWQHVAWKVYDFSKCIWERLTKALIWSTPLLFSCNNIRFTLVDAQLQGFDTWSTRIWLVCTLQQIYSRRCPITRIRHMKHANMARQKIAICADWSAPCNNIMFTIVDALLYFDTWGTRIWHDRSHSDMRRLVCAIQQHKVYSRRCLIIGIGHMKHANIARQKP